MFDATEKLQFIASVLDRHRKIFVPEDLTDTINRMYEYLSTYRTPSPEPHFNAHLLPSNLVLEEPAGPSSTPSFSESTTARNEELFSIVQHNIKINAKTKLESLYRYKVGAVVEFPKTSSSGRIGHLFEMDTRSWYDPASNFAYSQGKPNGSSGKKVIYCSVLVDDAGNEVPCQESHSTCQGSKACPFSDLDQLRTPHSCASRENIERRLAQSYTRHRPERELFQRTFAFFTAIKKRGCRAPISPHTPSNTEAPDGGPFGAQLSRGHRGYSPQPTCPGKVIFEYSRGGEPILRCELYNRRSNIDHFINLDIGRGIYDNQYLEALFNDDHRVISDYEQEAATNLGVGPLSTCTVVENASVIKVNCPSEHRDQDGTLQIVELIRLECKCKFRIYEPLEEYRERCPRILVTCYGEHAHPIPLLTKAPTVIRQGILEFLSSLYHDLPDLTPRRLLRHPMTEGFLRAKLPSITNPTMIDLHPSLGNKDHIRNLIYKAQETHFPYGTDWEGIIHLKKHQDNHLPPEEAYIRAVIELSYEEMARISTVSDDLEDDELEIGTTEGEKSFRMVVCMSPEASRLLVKAQYLQSDIGFKRVIGFKEFELGGMDIETRTSITYCRVFLNSQSAVAHCLIFDTIDKILFHDTGSTLRWRHLHAKDNLDLTGILHLGVDSHGGQAKGVGLHLVRKAQKLPVRADLHEPHRRIQDLDPYDHLRRFLRLCEIHFLRNIKKTPVPESIRSDMASLICIHHLEWDETLARIGNHGGKAGKDWLNDKIRAKFVFPAICWEKSFIPLVVWKVGDRTTNIIEEVHSDVNREGISCTLVGGVKKGQLFDSLKFKTIQNIRQSGINPYYQANTISKSIARSLKRKADSRHKILAGQDAKIETSNKRLKRAQDTLTLAHEALSRNYTEQSAMRVQRASASRDKAIKDSLQNVGKGSGKIGLLLPVEVPPCSMRHASSSAM